MARAPLSVGRRVPPGHPPARSRRHRSLLAPPAASRPSSRQSSTNGANIYLKGINPSGSFAKGTANRSGTDIDLFISLATNTEETLKEIYEKLFTRLTETGYTPKRQNVSINVKINGYSVDLVPGRRQDYPTQDHSLWRNKAGTWTKTNVNTHITHVRAYGRLQESRILKLWRDQQGLDFPSFYLELAVIDALSTMTLLGGLALDLSSRIRRIFGYLLDKFPGSRIVDPANSANIISEDLTARQGRHQGGRGARAPGHQLEPDRPMTTWSLSQLLVGLHDDVEHRLQIVRNTLGHPTVKGDGSAAVWLKLFETYLPRRYCAETAHVVDSNGTFSEQIDVAIYDRQYSPFIFHYEGQIVLPAENLYAAYGAKQTINAPNIDYAQKKVASVRHLHRTSLPIPYAGGTYPAKAPAHILGGILAFDSDRKPPLGDSLVTALGQNPDSRLDLSCAALHGIFACDANGWSPWTPMASRPRPFYSN